MIKVPTNGFKQLVKNNLTPASIVPSISKSDIKEFKIGKSYFYTIKNKTKFQIKVKTKDEEKTFCIYDILNAHFFKSIPLNNSTTSFRKNFSYLNFFEPHRHNYHFIRLDIRSFFHSIDIEDIKKVFKPYFHNVYIDENKTQHILDAFINLVTYEIPKNSSNVIKGKKGKRVLPMGFKTSPMISNVIFRQLDIQIQKLCSERNMVYTRYADDMLFSSSKDLNFIHSESFINEIRIIIAQLNFELNVHKTLKAKHTLSLNGYTIEYGKSELRFSNKRINIIKKMIYMIEIKEESADVILKKLFQYKINWKFKPKREIFEKYNTEQLLHKILGYRSYLLSIIQFNKRYDSTKKATVDKYLVIIENLEEAAERYQARISKLEELIEKIKIETERLQMQSLDKFPFTEWQSITLKNEGYKTLFSLKYITEKVLCKARGIGKNKAQKIIKIVKNELLKIENR